MRTTIEMPDALLKSAKKAAVSQGVSLKQFFISAVEQHLTAAASRPRLPLPELGGREGPPILPPTREQIEEAMFG